MTARTIAIAGAILVLAGIASFIHLRGGGSGERPGPSNPSPPAEPLPSSAAAGRDTASPLEPGADPLARAAGDPALRPPIPGTERFHYEAYLARFRALGDETEPARQEIVGRFLAGSTEPPERVGMLRASQDALSPLRAELFAAALAFPPADPPPGAEALPSFAVRCLADRLEEDPLARELLEEALFDRRNPLELPLRRLGISRLVAASSGDELADLRPLLAAERDESVRLSIAAELAVHPDREGAERLARALGLSLPEPSGEREE